MALLTHLPQCVKMRTCTYVFGLVYRHPSNSTTADLQNFENSMANVIEQLNMQKSIFYIAGDFNINLL